METAKSEAKMGYTEVSEHGTVGGGPDAPDQTQPQEVGLATSKRTTSSPAYQFYPSDFMRDENVLLMSYTEIGIYQVLLCRAWSNRGLPNDTAQIATILKLPHKRFLKLWAGPLSKCFVPRGDRLVNPRQELERQKQAEYRRRQSDNGKQGGRPPVSQNKPTENPPLSSSKARALKNEEEDLSSISVPKKIDVAFASFRDAYPAQRRKGGYLLERQFFDAVTSAGGAEAIMDALRNHLASQQWSDPKLIPGMDVWLREERWRQRLDPKGTVIDPKSPEWFQRVQARKAIQP